MTLDQLSAAATQGEWVADNHVIMLSPATTVACLENFNQWGDSKPTGNEANDAAFICQLVNLYRTGQLVAVADDAIERVARAMQDMPYMADWDDLEHEDQEHMREMARIAIAAMKDAQAALAAKGTGDE